MCSVLRGFPLAATLRHLALLYEGDADYLRDVGGFLEAGVAADEAVFVAVPRAKLDLLAPILSAGSGVHAVDMQEVGRNPARIIPQIGAFFATSRGRTVRFVGEPIWAGRTPAEIVEATRHEALINTAFGDSDAVILCPYDATRLDAVTLEDAERTHPTMVCNGVHAGSQAFADPLVVYEACDRPLEEPEVPAMEMTVDGDLTSFRGRVRAYVSPLLAVDIRSQGFLLAANEVATNTLAHGGGTGRARIWHDEREIVFEIADAGRVDDPLAGRRRPDASSERGRGLWLANSLCDLVELRSGVTGTTVRLHVDRR